MRFIYTVGFLGLAVFFGLAGGKIHNWKPIAFVLLWLVLICLASFPLLRLAKRFPPTKPYSDWCLIHSALKTLPAALLFSPTVVNLYMVAFPAPATLVLLGLLFLPRYKMQGGLLWGNISIAIGGFICFWFLIWVGKFIHQSQKLNKETDSRVSALGPILCISVIGAGIFGAAAWFLYRMITGFAGSGP